MASEEEKQYVLQTIHPATRLQIPKGEDSNIQRHRNPSPQSRKGRESRGCTWYRKGPWNWRDGPWVYQGCDRDFGWPPLFTAHDNFRQTRQLSHAYSRVGKLDSYPKEATTCSPSSPWSTACTKMWVRRTAISTKHSDHLLGSVCSLSVLKWTESQENNKRPTKRIVYQTMLLLKGRVAGCRD